MSCKPYQGWEKTQNFKQKFMIMVANIQNQICVKNCTFFTHSK